MAKPGGRLGTFFMGVWPASKRGGGRGGRGVVVVRAPRPEGRRPRLLLDPGSPCGGSTGVWGVGVAKGLPILLGGRRLLRCRQARACRAYAPCACLSYGVVEHRPWVVLHRRQSTNDELCLTPVLVLYLPTLIVYLLFAWPVCLSPLPFPPAPPAASPPSTCGRSAKTRYT